MRGCGWQEALRWGRQEICNKGLQHNEKLNARWEVKHLRDITHEIYILGIPHSNAFQILQLHPFLSRL